MNVARPRRPAAVGGLLAALVLSLTALVPARAGHPGPHPGPASAAAEQLAPDAAGPALGAQDVAAREPGRASGPSGVGDPYFPLDGNRGIDVEKYDVRVRYAFARKHLRGTTILTLRATQRLRRFNLDFLLPVRQVRVDGVPARHRTVKGHELVVRPAAPIEAGQVVRVRVTYGGLPGKWSYAGESNWLADRHEVVTINEPHMAPWWFPSNDHPSDKARFRVAITVPKGKQAVSNGRLVRKKRRGRATTWVWRADDRMATYLAFFAAGKFRLAHGTTDGRPWTLAVSKQLPAPQQRRSMRVLRRTPRIVSWLEKQLGPYPFRETGGVVTSLQAGFALETQTRPVYWALDRGDDWLLVHELAHQWFGNSVSVARWRDIWLNEGAATFMEVYYDEARGGTTGRQWLRQMYRMLTPGAGFWKSRIGNPGRRGIFDWPVYGRGGMTLQALRQRVGEEHFWQILRTWISERADGNGTSRQFERLAERVSGEDLGSFFQAWLRDRKRPARTADNGLL